MTFYMGESREDWEKRMTKERLAIQRMITRAYGVPDHLIGLPSGRLRRIWHKLTRRPGRG